MERQPAGALVALEVAKLLGLLGLGPVSSPQPGTMMARLVVASSVHRHMPYHQPRVIGRPHQTHAADRQMRGQPLPPCRAKRVVVQSSRRSARSHHCSSAGLRSPSPVRHTLSAICRSVVMSVYAAWTPEPEFPGSNRAQSNVTSSVGGRVNSQHCLGAPENRLLFANSRADSPNYLAERIGCPLA
jgi:hypothetical protein